MNSVCCWQGAENTIDLLQGFEGGVLSVLVRDPEQMVSRSRLPYIQSQRSVQSQAIKSRMSLCHPPAEGTVYRMIINKFSHVVISKYHNIFLLGFLTIRVRFFWEGLCDYQVS